RRSIEPNSTVCSLHSPAGIACAALPAAGGIAYNAGRPISTGRRWKRNSGMKIVLPGGTGQVGTLLARSFHARGDEVVVLGRSPSPAPWRAVPGDAVSVGEWAREIDGADVVINLAGRNVNCRYTPENRRQIMDSR